MGSNPSSPATIIRRRQLPKDDETWLNIGYMVFALMVFFVAKSAIEMLGVQMAWSERYDWYTYVETFGGLAVGVGSLFGRNPIRNGMSTISRLLGSCAR